MTQPPSSPPALDREGWASGVRVGAQGGLGSEPPLGGGGGVFILSFKSPGSMCLKWRRA